MSRFSGRQSKGAQRRLRELRMYQAYLRQVDGIARGRTVRWLPWTYEDPAYFLSRSAREEVAAGRIDVESYRAVTL